MLSSILAGSLLGNILAGKGPISRSENEETKSKRQGQGVNKAGEGFVRAGYGKKRQGNKWIFSTASSYDWFWNIIKMGLDLMVFILEIIYHIK